jgi:long-subunit fatty acid transport protein
MTTIRRARVALAFLVVTIGLTAHARAQTNDEIFPTLQWNFSTPGARANGMGRSFIAIADDASAAVTNPAGLMSLTRPQVYGEYKNTRLKVERLASANSLTSLAATANTSIVNTLSFLSASAPINNKIAVAFSIHRFLDYHEVFNLAPRPIPNDPAANLFRPVDGQADFTGTAYGGSVAYMITDQLRVGATVAANVLKADSQAVRTTLTINSQGQIVSSGIVANQTSIHDSQTAVSVNGGALYRINEMINVGFNFERSPRFNSSETLEFNPSATANQPLTTASGFPKSFPFNVPDHFGFGVSVRPNAKLLIAADGVRTNYSSLSKNTTIIFNGDPPQLTGSEYSTPDVTEFHVGAEYNVYTMMGNPLFVRGGVFTNPVHLVTYTGNITDRTTQAAEVAKYNLLPRSDETRGTVGVGIALGPRAQIDAAYVFSKEFVLSGAVRF